MTQHHFEKICHALEPDLADLADLAAVVLSLLEGDIAEAPEDGEAFVRIGATQATAIRWAGGELASRVSNLSAAFAGNFEAARRAAAVI